MRWHRTGESGQISASSATPMTVKRDNMAYWHPPILDILISARVDVLSDVKEISRDTTVSVMARNT